MTSTSISDNRCNQPHANDLPATDPKARGPVAKDGAAAPRGWFVDLVADSAGAPPDPIPNSAVKTLSADGTVSQDTGE